jgi:hypothetical protein
VPSVLLDVAKTAEDHVAVTVLGIQCKRNIFSFTPESSSQLEDCSVGD